jgi:hypothetical protein
MQETRKTKPAKRGAGATTQIEPVVREEWVRVAAYYRAERRGFQPGHDLEDWFAAEAGLTLAATSPTQRGRSRKTGTEARADR